MAKAAKLKLVSELPRQKQREGEQFVTVTSARSAALAFRLHQRNDSVLARVVETIVAPIPAKAGEILCWNPLENATHALSVSTADGKTQLRKREVDVEASDEIGALLDQLQRCGAVEGFWVDAENARLIHRASMFL